MTMKKKKQRLIKGMVETTTMTLMVRIRIIAGRVMAMTNLETAMEGMVLVVDKGAAAMIMVQTAQLVERDQGEHILNEPTIQARACLTVRNLSTT